jgi:phosphate/sulfate permease/DNA-binding CsgD family transcriptional regulator
MLFLLFLSSGLFLGWSLGSNDAANVFGTAVGSRMIKFRVAALIASIFVVIGAVFQGKGGAETLNSLGMVDALAGGFTISLSAAFTVLIMTKRGLPVSTSQAIVGAIIGWNLFTGRQPDLGVLTKIVSTWVSGPLLGMLFSALLYLLFKRTLSKIQVHVIRLDTYIRIGLVVAGAFGAYSLGANNIANVMGVFVHAAPDISLDFGIFVLDGTQLLFLMGGLAIALGIYTYSEKVMKTVGNGILSMSPEAAIIVVLAQAVVLFLFSSSSLSDLLMHIGLPPFPLVPVSSTQVVVGSVLGIGLVKGSREINSKSLGGIGLGWIATPVIAAVFCFFALFFVQNVFHLEISNPLNNIAGQQIAVDTPERTSKAINLILPGIILASALIIIVFIWLLARQQQLRLTAENELLHQQNQLYQTQRNLNSMEISSMQSAYELLNMKHESKRKEFIDMANNLTEQRLFLDEINKLLVETLTKDKLSDYQESIRNIQNIIHQKLTFASEKSTFYAEVEKIHKDFKIKLESKYPDLSEHDKKLATLIRLDLSNKEIATLMGISPKSVEVSRYRLKKKLGLEKDSSLIEFINQI